MFVQVGVYVVCVGGHPIGQSGAGGDLFVVEQLQESVVAFGHAFTGPSERIRGGLEPFQQTRPQQPGQLDFVGFQVLVVAVLRWGVACQGERFGIFGVGIRIECVGEPVKETGQDRVEVVADFAYPWGGEGDGLFPTGDDHGVVGVVALDERPGAAHRYRVKNVE